MRKFSTQQLSEKTLDRGIVSIWVVFIMAWFIPPMVRGDVLPYSASWYAEMAQWWIPFWNYAAEMLRMGFFPTWTPHILCGWPFSTHPMTNIYYSLFYPLIYLSYSHGVFLETIIEYSLLGAFTYYALRRLAISPAGSLAGMLASVGGPCVSMYSSYYVELRLFMMFAIMAWGMVGVSRDRPRFRYVLALMMGGFCFHDMEMAFYVAVFLVVAAWFLSPGGERWKRSFFISVIIVTYFVFAIWILISLIAYMPHSLRSGGVTFDYFMKHQQPLKALLLAIYPEPRNIPGLPVQTYIGWIVLWLGGYGLIKLGRNAIPIALGIVFILLYSISWPPLMAIVYHLPFFSRTVLHYSAFVTFFMLLAAIVGFGVDAALSRLSETRRHFLFPALLALLMMATLIYLDDLVRGILLGVLGVAGLILAVKDLTGFRKPLFSLWIVAFLVLDILVISVRDRPLTPVRFFEMHPKARDVLSNAGLTRFWTVSRLSLRDNRVHPIMGMNLDPFLPGTHSPLSYWRVSPTRIARLINLACPGYIKLDEQGMLLDFHRGKAMEEGSITSRNLPLLSLMNVGIIFSRMIRLPFIDGLRLIEEEDDLLVYRNDGALPRAFFVNDVELADDPEQALEMMTPGRMDYSRRAVLEGDFSSPPLVPPCSGEKPELFLIEARPGLWEFEIRGVEDEGDSTLPQHLLLLTEARFPGWRAELDGIEVPIFYADYVFMGILVPGGDHSLRLVHQPVEFGIGLYTMLSSACFWLFLIILHMGRLMLLSRRRQQS